jgi:hypothetical protein
MLDRAGNADRDTEHGATTFMSAPGEIQSAGLRSNEGNDGMAFRQGAADDQLSGPFQSQTTNLRFVEIDG